MLYENADGPDTAEYVEILKIGTSAVNIGGWQIVPVSGTTGEATAAAVSIPTLSDAISDYKFYFKQITPAYAPGCLSGGDPLQRAYLLRV